jgi:regulation of enolase protein 1 (concanavalin A-like superfamily)
MTNDDLAHMNDLGPERLVRPNEPHRRSTNKARMKAWACQTRTSRMKHHTAGPLSASASLSAWPAWLRTLAIGLFCAAALPASAATLYVSGSGSDKFDGSSPDKAFRNPAKAAAIVNPGDVVYLMDGQYPGFDLKRPGTADKPIRWVAYANAKPEIPWAGRWNAIMVLASYQVIDGLTLTGNNDHVTLEQAEADYNASGSGSPIYNNNAISIDNRNNAFGQRVHHLTVRNCVIRKFGGGGVGGDGDYFVIENNKIYENAWYSRYANSGGTIFTKNVDFPVASGYHNVVANNVFWSNMGFVKWKSQNKYSDGNGFILDVSDADYNGRTLISGNLVVNNGGSGIHSFQGRHADIVNNTGYMNGQRVGYADIYAAGSHDIRLLNNVAYSRNGGNANDNGSNTDVVYDYNIYFNGKVAVKGAHDVVADPQFVRASLTPPLSGDFHLKAGSPGIDSASRVGGTTPSVDLASAARPLGAGLDRGAFETVPAIAAPVIDSGRSLAAQVGTPVSYTIHASGTPTRFGATNLPAGLTVDTATGRIAGTPTTAGATSATVSATNAGGTGSATLAITVAAAPPTTPPPPAAPVLTTPVPQTARVGTAFSFQIQATGATSYAASGLPKGLSVNTSTGLISGTPVAVGISSIAVSATNAGGSRSATLTLTVALPVPVISSASTANAVVGSAFHFQVLAGPAITAYAATGLAPGLAIDASTGVISGTPGTSGDYTVALAATNSAGVVRGSLALHVASTQDSGWQAVYFDNIDLTGKRVLRTDKTIAFEWGGGSPAAGIGVDKFSARWRAHLVAPTTGTYTLTTTSDDGVRLWVDGRLVIDQWVDASSVEHSASVALTAGQGVQVAMEYYDNTNNATARLEWQGPGVARQVVPESAVSVARDSSIPGAWSSAPVGAAATGSASETDGSWTLASTGGDIWNKSDAFEFAAQRVTGDVTAIACVDKLVNSDPWAKAGLMLRESNQPGARHASLFVTAANGVAFQRRLQADGASTHTAGPSHAAPYCLRIVRSGNVFIASASSDRKTWKEIRRDTIAMGSSIWVGLAASSHSTSAATQATFSQVSIEAAAK